MRSLECSKILVQLTVEHQLVRVILLGHFISYHDMWYDRQYCPCDVISSDDAPTDSAVAGQHDSGVLQIHPHGCNA